MSHLPRARPERIFRRFQDAEHLSQLAVVAAPIRGRSRVVNGWMLMMWVR
jgi:hypothetical protein